MATSSIGFPQARTNLPTDYNLAPMPGPSSGGPSNVSTASAARFTQVKDEHKQHGTGAKILKGLKSVFGRSGSSKSRPTLAKAAKSPWSAASPTVRTKLNDTTLIKGSVAPLSGNAHGAFNAPVKGTFREMEIGTRQAASPGHREVVGKYVGPQLHNGGEVTIQVGVGVSGHDPRMIERNVATSILDTHLQTGSVPKASAGILGDRAIVAMSVAPGQTAKQVYAEHPGIVTHPDFQRQMSDIEVNAFLNANPDAHSENYMIDFKRDDQGNYTDVKATMIDNDMSFGHRMLNPDQPTEFFTDMKVVSARTYRQTGLPAYMDAGTCTRVKAMDIETVAQDLSSQLTGDELVAFKSRGNLLKDHVQFLEENNRVVGDWAKFESPTGEALAGGDFISGTLEMSGVQQGARRMPSGEVVPVTSPRSMILRDWVQGDYAQKTGFNSDPGTTAEQKDAVAAWGHVEPKIVPPSGRAHLDSLTPAPKVPTFVERRQEAEAMINAQDGADANEADEALAVGYQVTPASNGGVTSPVDGGISTSATDPVTTSNGSDVNEAGEALAVGYQVTPASNGGVTPPVDGGISTSATDPVTTSNGSDVNEAGEALAVGYQLTPASNGGGSDAPVGRPRSDAVTERPTGFQIPDTGYIRV